MASVVLVSGLIYLDRQAARLQAGPDLFNILHRQRLQELETQWIPGHFPGHDRPATVQASEAHLSEDEQVLGVVVEGQARAYRLLALRNPADHVVNDVIQDQPISVTYCDVSDCSRAFTGTVLGTPLDIQVGGRWQDNLILRVDGNYYEQTNGRAFDTESQHTPWPLISYPLTRTTWANWHAAYPHTDVYEESGSSKVN